MPPRIHPSAYVHPTAALLGDVDIAARASVWPHASLRADMGPIRVGEATSIQDGCVLHTDPGGSVELGRYVTVGHRAVVHGATVGDETIVGMGAIILEGARVGRGCIVAAGAVVKEGSEIPDHALVAGVPARVVRIDEALVARARPNAERYVALAERYRKGEIS
ncbi:MAG TPA: gamma carbonic anhydrase family protein [Candidatus Thermoplasmatota archaeon]|nr:gamma carbonic anhydrase family protein [Candidatus Thermoplasmatota archaeon]